VDVAYLVGELAGGKAKAPFVAAISLSAEGRDKIAPVPGFTRKAIVAGLTETCRQVA
jgi:hypothetical protein